MVSKNPIAVMMGSNHGLFANFIKITDGGGGGELPIGWILMGTGLIILSGAGVYYLWKRKKH